CGVQGHPWHPYYCRQAAAGAEEITFFTWRSDFLPAKLRKVIRFTGRVKRLTAKAASHARRRPFFQAAKRIIAAKMPQRHKKAASRNRRRPIIRFKKVF
ncbi:MAG: hypothetical protein IK008_03515, partial [Bacteroidales bacterium]|nr:hypothetical protein [Bacteroidales bacterium]